MIHPRRYVHLDAARARHGRRVDELGAWLRVGDPLADAVADELAALGRAERAATIDRALHAPLGRHASNTPASVRALLATLDTAPEWADRERMERGAAAFVATGPGGGLVLGCYSLVLGYCSPAGNKPLALSGRLTGDARRRLAETSRFVQAVTAPGGMRRGADGWIAAVKVRLMHASVRRMLLRSPAWRLDDWGTPINAFDSAGTVLLFSFIVLEGLAGLGHALPPVAREDLLHLWRFVGHVMGVPAALLWACEAEARAFWDLLSTTQEPPDEDARILTRTLLDDALAPAATTPLERAHAQTIRGVGYAVSRRLLGPAYAAGLALPPPDRWDDLLDVACRLNRAAPVDLPGTRRLRYRSGRRYWERAVETGLGGRPADFAMAARLGVR